MPTSLAPSRHVVLALGGGAAVPGGDGAGSRERTPPTVIQHRRQRRKLIRRTLSSPLASGSPCSGRAACRRSPGCRRPSVDLGDVGGRRMFTRYRPKPSHTSVRAGSQPLRRHPVGRGGGRQRDRTHPGHPDHDPLRCHRPRRAGSPRGSAGTQAGTSLAGQPARSARLCWTATPYAGRCPANRHTDFRTHPPCAGRAEQLRRHRPQSRLCAGHPHCHARPPLGPDRDRRVCHSRERGRHPQVRQRYGGRAGELRQDQRAEGALRLRRRRLDGQRRRHRRARTCFRPSPTTP